MLDHDPLDLITIFNSCFTDDLNTRLIKGEDEPIYLPAHDNQPYHAIFFAHGFFSSALHECAHWLIAGKERRQQIDYGYWYVPDGRDALQQSIFQQVEVKPQALEWILSTAAAYPFRLSVDNLNGEETDNEAFKSAIYQQVRQYCEQGLPSRAQRLYAAICHFYQRPTELKLEQFNPCTLNAFGKIS